jgi:hypothetical protein
VREPAGGDRPWLAAEFSDDPRGNPVDQAGEAEDHAGLDRPLGRLADRRRRLGEVDPRDPRPAFGQCGQ